MSPFATQRSLRALFASMLGVLTPFAGHAADTSPPPTAPAPPPPPTHSAPTSPPTHAPNFPSTNPLPAPGRLWTQLNQDPIFQLRELHRRWSEIFRDDIAPPVFFPPSPPALAESPSNDAARPPAKDYPVGLIDFVGESFYMAYGSLLHRDLLSPKRAERIEAYRSKRRQLLAELRARLDETKHLPLAERTSARHAFASTQDAALRELEAEAEAIRLELTAPGIFKTHEDGTALLASAREFASTRDELSVSFVLPIVAAQFFEGFSLEQRLLLREIGMEARARATSPETRPSASAAGYVFFSPATARIRLPDRLPPDLADTLERYETLKRDLKQELQEAIAREDFVFIFQRAERFQKLAQEHAPRIATLHALAEELRLALARIPYPDAPKQSDLPPELTRRVGLAVARKADLQRELTARYKTLREELGANRVEIVRDGKALGLSLAAPQRLSPARRNRITGDLTAFNDDLRRRYIALSDEMETLRRDLQQHASATSAAAPQDVERLAAEFNKSYAAQETWTRFHDYFVAVLEPGLSPEQRRLLYGAALVGLFNSPAKPAS